MTVYPAPPLALGGALGLLLGIGLALVAFSVTRSRRRRVEDRVEPYIRRGEERSALLPTPAAARGRAAALVHPLVPHVIALIERIGSGRSQIERRLLLSGGDRTVEGYRVEQVIWGSAGLLLGAGCGALAGAARGAPALLAFVLAAVGGLGGVVLRDWWLGHAVVVRSHTMMREFPTVADMLALAVSAGEPPIAALERVAHVCRGELPGEFARTVNDIRAGAPMGTALAALGARCPLASVARFTDGIAVAIERGTPLADVLRAQAQDVRELSKRELLEAAGKKEIGMLVPVVFLIMPLVVVFAVFPGISVLDLTL